MILLFKVRIPGLRQRNGDVCFFEVDRRVEVPNMMSRLVEIKSN